MTPHFLRRILLTAFCLQGAVTGTAAVQTEPFAPIVVGGGSGTILIDNDHPGATMSAPNGNPLRAIPLKELSATRERPIFSPSRRPPSPAATTAPYVLPSQTEKPPESERPQLLLVGTIAGDKESFGIFLDSSANTVLRLKTGEGHKGWILREVRSREIVLEKDDKMATLALPVRPLVAPVRHDEGEKNLKRFKR